MHKGEDTDFYLSKGFKVVAFEADSDLIKKSKDRFKKNIFTKYFLKIFRKLTGIPTPGWYDTHARYHEND